MSSGDPDTRAAILSQPQYSERNERTGRLTMSQLNEAEMQDRLNRQRCKIIRLHGDGVSIVLYVCL
jgi:hypothetical protein